MRLFLAIKANPDIYFLEKFRSLKAQLRHEPIRWADEKNIHITLKFLGETSEERLPEIIRISKGITEPEARFSYRLSKLGIFGSSYSPRVIWVGIEPFEEFSGLMGAFREKMVAAGFGADRQNLVPHLTLGRLKPLNDRVLFQKILEQNCGISSGYMKANSIILYQSILKKDGPEYLAIHEFRLSG